MDIFIRFFSDLMTAIGAIKCWSNCIEYNIYENKKKYFLLAIIITIGIYICSKFIPNPLKLFSIFGFLIIVNNIFMSKTIKKSLFSVLISQLIVLTVEFILVFICSFAIGDKFKELSHDSIFILLLDFAIMIFMFVLSKINIPRKIFIFLNEITSTIKKTETFSYMFMIIIVLIISLAESYMKLPVQIILITNVIMAIIFIAITLRMTIVKSKLNKIDSKYQTSMTSLKEHELLIDKLRINNHENKNELLTIRNMIKDKKTIKYIDKLVDNKVKDNEKIMKKTVKIPEGGLRATIYSKMCLMDKENINYNLDIAKNIKTTDLISLDDEIILNICKILGVFLDNAIEAVKNLKKKIITIELYKIERDLYIGITNNFEGSINIDKISKTKYSSKGEERGYGLSLVNKIINENKEILENEKEINGNNFTQILKIKM